ncbi:MAG: Rnf-Nqr domain containing protein [Acutalibacteraceae bacterium]|nr:Rnf-Nqr domain containing protein [Acutalibacteraceae bacterium]
MAKNKKQQPKLKIKTALFKGSFVHNPVLTQVIGICPIVAVATTVRNAIAVSLAMFLALTVCEAITSLLLKKAKRYIRVALYAVISCITIAIFEPVLLLKGSAPGIYIYLIAVNALITIRCEKFACRTNLRNSLVDSIACTVGFGTVALIVGALRELMTYGTVFPAENALPKITAASMPFTALVIIGILAAIHKAYIIKFHPQEETDTFILSSAEDKTVFKDPGLGKKGHKAKRKVSDEENFDMIRPRYSIEDIPTQEREDENA